MLEKAVFRPKAGANDMDFRNNALQALGQGSIRNLRHEHHDAVAGDKLLRAVFQTNFHPSSVMASALLSVSTSTPFFLNHGPMR